MIKGFLINGNNYSFEESIEMSLCGKIDIPFSYLSVLVNDLKKEHHFPSPSVVFDCPRKIFIQKNYDYYIDPNSASYLFRGTMLHQTLENVRWKNALKEHKVDIDTGDFKLKGTCDLFLIDQKQIRDYKTISKIAVNYTSGGIVPANYLYKEQYFNQLNLYVLGLRQANFEVETAFIEYYGMDSATDLPVLQIPVPIDTDLACLRTNNSLHYITKYLESGIAPPLNYCVQNWGYLCTKAKVYCNVKDVCTKIEQEK
jgi:hypothetical protein